MRLERGRLEFKTDDAGTLYLEWDKLSSLVTTRVVEVLTTDGRRFLGSLGSASARLITVVTSEGLSLQMSEVTLITPIGTSFWRKLDGSIDAGFSYTQSSGVAQLNVNSDTVFRQLASRTRLTASLTQTKKEDDPGRDDRAFAELSYLRYPWQRWFILTAGRFETNESVGLTLRSQVARPPGPVWSTAIARNSCSAPAWRSMTSRAWMSRPRRTSKRCSRSRPRSTPTIGRRPTSTSACSTTRA